ncbi:MAG: class SAM-dependent methyltransferase [Actinomycetia bacterium]|nr:class SAM-dependent methyltransferase [Actinomycetes bacterium]
MRAISTRRLVLYAAAGSAVAVAGVMTLGLLGVLVTADAMWLSAVIGAFGVLVVALIALRWADRRVVALSRRLSRLDEKLTSVSSTTDSLRPRLDKLSSDVSTVSAGLKDLSRTSAANYNQLEAYIDLRSLIQPRAPMPSLRGWAASPDVLRFLMETMLRQRPKLIVECGSGSSSIWLGYLAEQIAPAKVICLEHDERFGRISRDLIRAHDLGDVVEIRHAPLADWKGAERVYSWYDVEALEDLADIGLLFVDGPPEAIGSEARYPAMPLLLPRCADDAVIVLDDSDRKEETALSDRWLAECPDIERSVLRFEKGAHVFTRRMM